MLKEALASYQLALKEDPEQPDVWHCTGIVLAQLQKYQDALSHFAKAIDQDPENAIFHNSNGNTLSALGNYVEATKAYDKAIKYKPDYAIARANLGNSFYRQKKFAIAKCAYEQAILLAPDLANAHFNYALLLTDQGDITKALEELKITVALEPQHISALSQLAHLYLFNKDYSNAILYYQKRLSIQPQHAETHHDLGLAFLQIKEYHQAISHFKQSLLQKKKVKDIDYHLATAYLQIGNYQDALIHYLQQLEIEPHLESLYNVAVLHMYHERHEQALSYFNAVFKIDADHLESHINIAAVYLKLKNLNSAVLHYSTALSINPDNDEIKHIISALKQENIQQSAPIAYVKHLFDQYAPYYDQHLTTFLHYQAPQLLYKALDHELNLTTGITIFQKSLDLGCGTGLCGQLFKTHTQQLIGIDLSEKMLAIAKEKNCYDELHSFSVIEALDQILETDLILASDVFTYIGDLTEIFLKAEISLNHHGIFAFTVEKTYDHDYHLQTNIRYAHSEKYLKKLIKKHQFETLRFDSIALRTQFGKEVSGYLIVLKKNG